MPTHTPWGLSQSSRTLAQGIREYTTASHGGIHLSPRCNAQIAECWRIATGWYEEDCDWAIVAYHFPEAFSGVNFELALQTLKSYKPDEYTLVTGKNVTLEESHKLRERAFREATKDKLVTVAAFGDWHPKIPKGYVGAIAYKGGRPENGMYASDLRYFLVPRAEYHAHQQSVVYMGFTIDETRHQEVEKFDG